MSGFEKSIRQIWGGVQRGVGFGIGCVLVFGTVLLAQTFTSFSSGDLISSSAINDNFTNLRNRQPPVGSILPWHKSFTGTPALPVGWVECDGATLNDTESVFHGQVIPDLNSTNYLLQGEATSGATAGVGVHTHGHTLGTTTTGAHFHTTINSVAGLANLLTTTDGDHAHGVTGAISNSGGMFTAFRVVYIMRVK